jgi:L-aminopeptidase/D-esterase-like protein
VSGTLTDVRGVAVGHWTDREAATGCTVVLCEEGAVGGVSVRGASPGTRETDLLDPLGAVQRVDAVLLTGGSAFGLDACRGVMRWLEERGAGYAVGRSRVPIVPAAVLFDLHIGSSGVRPGPAQGYAACGDASSDPVATGSVGAGTGAIVGALFGVARATKGGAGCASLRLGSGVTVAALAAVNAFGQVRDPATGAVLAGARDGEGRFVDVTALLAADDGRATGPRDGRGSPAGGEGPGGSTTLVVVATDAVLDKVAANAMAAAAHDGLARAIDPCHTPYDGDTVFVVATGASGRTARTPALSAVAARVVSEAIVDGVRQATGLGGVPSVADLESGTHGP